MSQRKAVFRTMLAATVLFSTAASVRAADLPSWADHMESLKNLGEPLLAESGRGDTEARRQDMYKYILGAVADGYLNYVLQDPSRPTWTPLWNYGLNYGGPNPDYAYKTTLVDPKGVYRISGYRGTSRFVEITEQPVEYISPAMASTRVPATYDLDSLHQDKDGYFSVILSAERPPGYTGDWWQLHPVTHALLMRQTSYDWQHEVDPRIAIVRLDDAPPLSPEETAQRMAGLKDFVAGIIQYDMRLTRYYREHHGVNTIKISELMASQNPFPGQVYVDGTFQLKDDEALILETSVPKTCRYWQILLADDRFATIDWVNHQTNLNGHTAKIDKDGRFRAVIAPRDPGVANWLDTAGEPWGIIQMRWNRCSEAPEPKVTKVALKDVRKLLPADTPVVTPEERKQQLRARQEAAQFRHLW
jgi:hypothetical protein